MRHTKDGMLQNQLSKSSLIIAINELINKLPNVIEYFPSYEILMDELRDYRWYADDLIHPSTLTEKYIFQKFSETYFDKNNQLLIDNIMKINQRIQHKPIFENSLGYYKHVKQTIQQINDFEILISKQLKNSHSIDFTEEKIYLNKVLSTFSH